jgi:hypothetical protein
MRTAGTVVCLAWENIVRECSLDVILGHRAVMRLKVSYDLGLIASRAS